MSSRFHAVSRALKVRPVAFLMLAAPAVAIATEPDSDTYALTTLPATTVLVGSLPAGVGYFDGGYSDYKPLLDYLDDNDIEARPPVEGDPNANPGELFFPLKDADIKRALPASNRIRKLVIPQRLVARFTFRGGYDKETLDDGEKKLRAWLKSRPGYRVTGPVSYAYWSPYYQLPFLKKAEVRLPVEAVPPESAADKKAAGGAAAAKPAGR